MVNNKISITRGDTYTRTINLKDAAGDLIDATGWTICFTVRIAIPDTSTTADVDAVIAKEIPGDVSGIQTLLLTSSDTDIEPASYFYDFQIKKDDGTITSSIRSLFIVSGDITRAT